MVADERPPKFVADPTLARLARWLRLIGADVICDEALRGAAALARARAEGCALLTRDKRLRTAPDALYLKTQVFREQLREVLTRHPFDARRFAFTRCLACNQPLATVPRQVVARRVPPFVFAAQDEFAVCTGCGHIYWEATHVTRARRELAALGL